MTPSSTDDREQPEGISESSPENDQTFIVMVDRKLVWAIQQVVHPGMPFLKNDQTMAMPAFRWQQYALALRWKVNAAILRFEDEEDTKQIELNITEAEGWILDQSIPFDGDAGMGGLLLVQVFRGMWGLRMDEMGSTLPSHLVPEPQPIPEATNPQETPEVKPDTSDPWIQLFQQFAEDEGEPA